MTSTSIAPGLDQSLVLQLPHHAPAPASPAPLITPRIISNWRETAPVLVGEKLTLRGLQASDAGSLLSMLATNEVSRFMSSPPATLDGFERFIAWADRKREEGSYVCFGIVPHGMDDAVGVFQLRALDASFSTAEWGFALGRPFWGTGLFVEGATHTLDFAFGAVGVQRLEARSALGNGRGNAALRKIGAIHEAVLRRSFRKDGLVHDQSLWSILDIDWFAIRGRALELQSGISQRWH
jgi:RimJ/RimL family protein N-acetyltransferase